MRFVRGSREISLVPSLHRASTDALIEGSEFTTEDLMLLLYHNDKIYVSLYRCFLPPCFPAAYDMDLLLAFIGGPYSSYQQSCMCPFFMHHITVSAHVQRMLRHLGSFEVFVHPTNPQ